MGIFEIIAGPLMKVVDKLVPDPAAKAQAQIELLKLQQAGEFKELEVALEMSKAQTSVNLEEARNTNLFVSGWRPFMGWACGFIFVANFIGVPFLAWLSPLIDLPPPPRLDIGEVLPVLMGMLGLGGLRTAERLRGKA